MIPLSFLSLFSSVSAQSAPPSKPLIFCSQTSLYGVNGQCERLQLLEVVDSIAKGVSMVSKKWKSIRLDKLYSLLPIQTSDKLTQGTVISLPSELFSASGSPNSFTLCTVAAFTPGNSTFEVQCGTREKRKISRSVAFKLGSAE